MALKGLTSSRTNSDGISVAWRWERVGRIRAGRKTKRPWRSRQPKKKHQSERGARASSRGHKQETARSGHLKKMSRMIATSSGLGRGGRCANSTRTKSARTREPGVADCCKNGIENPTELLQMAPGWLTVFEVSFQLRGRRAGLILVAVLIFFILLNGGLNFNNIWLYKTSFSKVVGWRRWPPSPCSMGRGSWRAFSCLNFIKQDEGQLSALRVLCDSLGVLCVMCPKKSGGTQARRITREKKQREGRGLVRSVIYWQTTQMNSI